MKKITLTLLLLLTVGAVSMLADAPSIYAIRNARVVTVSGAVLERGTVLIRDGLIQEVGANVNIPSDAAIIEGQGLTVYPGLIDALSTLGLPEYAPAPAGNGAAAGGRTTTQRTPAQQTQAAQTPPAQGPEDRPQTTSWLNAADIVSPSDRRIESARNLGFTTAVSFPNRGIIAGQGAVIDLAGEKAGEMVVAEPVGMYMTMGSGGRGGGMGGGFPSSLFGIIAYVKQVYLDLDHYKLVKAAYQKNPVGMKRPEYDRALEGVLQAPRILLPANRAVEIDRMLRLSGELKAKTVLYGGNEGYKMADALKQAGTPVLVDIKWPEPDRNADPERQDSLRILEMRDKAPSTPAVLKKAGVPFAFYVDSTYTARDLNRYAKRALDSGLSQNDLVRAFTLSAAEIFGVADRLGSIDKGKIANLVVTDGDLFNEKTKVKYIFVDGVRFEPAPEPVQPARGEVAQ
jgi:imidazolonepropionase-like amidohydrolase